MKFKLLVHVLVLALIVILINGQHSYAQIVNQENLSSIKVDALSDDQIRAIIEQIRAEGIADDQLEKVVLSRGLPQEEVAKLKTRISALKEKEGELDVDNKDIVNTVKGRKEFKFEKPKAIEKEILPLYGSQIFASPNLFDINTNRPTPSNYIVGPGDQLQINVYGKSLVDWRVSVTPEGFVMLPGMGKVYVGGKRLQQATNLIKDRLRANNYAIGNGTFVDVSLTNIRTIQVTIIGEVEKPGTYPMTSVQTVLNALYASGGPTQNGSFREIEVIRNGRVHKVLDIYDILQRADIENNIYLQDDDIIRIPVYQVRVAIEGEIKRPGIYEVKKGETLQDVINFGGGLTDSAYTTRIKAVQLTDTEKKVKDIVNQDIKTYIPQKGDKYIIDQILDRFENRVTINGAVYRPGQFELTSGLKLSELIRQADGLKQDAFAERGYVTRLNENNETQIIQFQVKNAAQGEYDTLQLKREDIISIPSIFDLRETYNVTVNGSIRKGGNFPFSEGMTVEDLILMAGGLSEGANTQRVEIARRIKDSDRQAKDAKLAEIITLSIDRNLTLESSKYKLEPYDIVSVFSVSGYEVQRSVQIQGEVMNPGYFTLSRKDERISDIVRRAGGFSAYAYTNAATLQRGTENIGIDLPTIMQNPKSKWDLLMQSGDIIIIPMISQLVKVNGEVLRSKNVVFDKRSFKSYIINSGGFTQNALKRKSYVIYANGEVKATRNFLLWKIYPEIEPGTQVYVPRKKEKKETMTVQSWIGLSTSMGTLAAIIFAILRK
ncbi:SLBB domain-containing protein [Siphonobacter sp. SORGH_AS_1065]|uniref:SLBB domain-containing protein n=1 Tax=Siphonobacter sp. SORGH_AS_1065 TaxID=3041795 RepID=UPI00278010D1|nr:SLBB domain-containing protein [Siphonobacter sp. SORGH_AS_1065]MDQ1087546.1 protein involved in polysaccharide export with SLBB domain [Siphonobacter sp. SORGH_AS_1065]